MRYRVTRASIHVARPRRLVPTHGWDDRMIRGELRLSCHPGILDWPPCLLSLPWKGSLLQIRNLVSPARLGPAQPKGLRLFPEVSLTKVPKESRGCID
jgi:hypothetical protein